MTDRHPIWQLADEIQMDLRAATSKLVSLRAQIAALNLDATAGQRPECPICTASFPGDRTLAEHMFNQHDGPVPAHWAAIEHASLDPVDLNEEATT